MARGFLTALTGVAIALAALAGAIVVVLNNAGAIVKSLNEVSRTFALERTVSASFESLPVRVDWRAGTAVKICIDGGSKIIIADKIFNEPFNTIDIDKDTITLVVPGDAAMPSSNARFAIQGDPFKTPGGTWCAMVSAQNADGNIKIRASGSVKIWNR